MLWTTMFDKFSTFILIGIDCPGTYPRAGIAKLTVRGRVPQHKQQNVLLISCCTDSWKLNQIGTAIRIVAYRNVRRKIWFRYERSLLVLYSNLRERWSWMDSWRLDRTSTVGPTWLSRYNECVQNSTQSCSVDSTVRNKRMGIYVLRIASRFLHLVKGDDKLVPINSLVINNKNEWTATVERGFFLTRGWSDQIIFHFEILLVAGHRLNSFSKLSILVHLVFVDAPTSIRLALRCYDYAYVKRERGWKITKQNWKRNQLHQLDKSREK